jgi:hypothetical protein
MGGELYAAIGIQIASQTPVSSAQPRMSFEEANATHDQTKRKFDEEPEGTPNKRRLSRRLEYLERCMDDTFYERENNGNVEN